MQFSVRNLNMQIFGQNWGFFWWNFCQKRNLDEMFAPFAQCSRDLFFSRLFFRTGFRTFSHDFRTTRFFQVFLCTRCLHDVRARAVGRRVCRDSIEIRANLVKFTLSIGAPQKNFLQRKTLTNSKMNTSGCFGYSYSWFCVKTEDYPKNPNILMIFGGKTKPFGQFKLNVQNFPKTNNVCFRLKCSCILC